MSKPVTHLITGANGFIGSHLVDQIARQENSEVLAFDRFSRKPTFIESANVEIHKADLKDTAYLEKLLSKTDYFFHCFSETNPYVSDKDPYEDLAALTRTVKIFELCANAKIKKVIFISSGGSIYGDIGKDIKATESLRPNPISPYGIGKLAAEHYLEYFRKKYGLEYISYRLTNPYGDRQVYKHGQGVIPLFVEKILNHEEIVVLGSGQHSRDYIYIEDAIKMIMKSYAVHNKSRLYNIGSGKQTTLIELIDVIKEIVGHEVMAVYNEAPTTFLHKTDVSIERFTKEFGIQELTSLYDGIKRTIQTVA